MHQKDMESRKTKSTSFPRDALEQAQIAKRGWEKVGRERGKKGKVFIKILKKKAGPF